LKKTLIAGALCSCLWAAPLAAQQNDTSGIDLDPVVLSAWRSGEKLSRIAQPATVLTQRDIRFLSQPTTAELLQNTGQVFIQKSQLGGGSPVLRGFEANKVLMVVDGIRMNNAIYRGGHLQDVITVDQNMLSRVEVLFGPSSVMYGSDAIGGVMHFYSADPVLSTDDKKPLIRTGAMLRYGSAMQEQTANYYINAGGRYLGIRLAATHSQFGDLRSGSRRSFDDTTWGKRNWYQSRINNRDTFLRNDDPLVQKGSAYRQTDVFGKILYNKGSGYAHMFNFQYSGSDDVPRFDRLSEWRNGAPRFAVWTYAPQNRALAAYSLNISDQTGLFGNGKITAAWQQQEQGRVTRRYRNDNEVSQQEKVNVWSLNADFNATAGKQEWRYGIEAVHNEVQSTAISRNIVTGEARLSGTRYPDGGSSMYNLAAYVHQLLKSSNGKWFFNTGLRATYSGLKAQFTEQSLIGRFSAEQRYPVLTLSEGVTFRPGQAFQLKAVASTGFRAPNVDDLGKVFESQTGLLIIPNTDMRAEQVVNGDLSAVWTIANRHRLEAGVFYTHLNNALVLMDDQLNGQDSVLFQGSMSKVRSMQNAATAYSTGVWASLYIDLGKGFSTRHTWNYTYGRYRASADAVDVPLDHIPPAYGQSNLQWRHKQWQAEIFYRWSAAKQLEDYSPSGEDNLQYALPSGMPSWDTWNMRAAWTASKAFTVQLAVENLADRHYRTFSSGISAPGRNLLLTVRADIR
jgi:hemoglobin/transferrin/lactoferrin receptor protein